MRTFAYLLILVAAVSIVCGCGAKDVATDFSSCQIDFYKTTKQLTKEQEQDFRYSCMRSKGYAFGRGDDMCHSVMASGIVTESCFYKRSLLVEIKELFQI